MTASAPIHIALTFDDNFWAPAFATMRSVCLATHRKTDLHFHLCHLSLSADHKADLKRIADEFGASLHWYDLSASDIFQRLAAPAKATKRWPSVVYARLLFTEILPRDIDRLVYLDCDVYVRAPIERLAETDLQGFPVAGVPDILFPFVALRRDIREKSDLFDAADPYFNSGVLVIDLAKWRGMDLPGLFEKAQRDGLTERLYYDQDFLNLTFRNNWLPIEWRWNVMDARPAHEALAPYILHYTSKRKPWHLVSGVAFSRVYRHVMTNDVFYRFMRKRIRGRLPFTS